MHALMYTTSADERNAADRWLSEFLSQPDSWCAAEALLSAEDAGQLDANANLFGGILLHNKIQHHFSQLEPSR